MSFVSRAEVWHASSYCIWFCPFGVGSMFRMCANQKGPGIVLKVTPHRWAEDLYLTSRFIRGAQTNFVDKKVCRNHWFAFTTFYNLGTRTTRTTIATAIPVSCLVILRAWIAYHLWVRTQCPIKSGSPNQVHLHAATIFTLNVPPSHETATLTPALCFSELDYSSISLTGHQTPKRRC